jgi:hypothetical protein
MSYHRFKELWSGIRWRCSTHHPGSIWTCNVAIGVHGMALNYFVYSKQSSSDVIMSYHRFKDLLSSWGIRHWCSTLHPGSIWTCYVAIGVHRMGLYYFISSERSTFRKINSTPAWVSVPTTTLNFPLLLYSGYYLNDSDSTASESMPFSNSTCRPAWI